MKEFSAVNVEEIKGDLRTWLSDAESVVVAGVGSLLRKDDFVGVEVVRNLRNRVSPAVYLIECETVPESFIAPISEFKPTHVLIVDAAMLGSEPGSVRLIEPQEIGGVTVSTHALPLRIFSEYLVEATGAKVALLAIQPKETDFGEGLTPRLEETAKALAGLLTEILP